MTIIIMEMIVSSSAQTPAPSSQTGKWEQLQNSICDKFDSFTKRFLTSLPGWFLHFELFKVFNFRSGLSEKRSIKVVYNTYTNIYLETNNFNVSIWRMRGQEDAAILGVYKRQTLQLTQHSAIWEMMYNCAQSSNTFTVVLWPHQQIDLLENSIHWWHSLHISRISKVCNIDCISKLAGITSLLSPWVVRVRRGVINDQIRASDWSVRPNTRLSLADHTWSFKKRNKETRLAWHLHLMATGICLK